jgi:hypothetical protein
MTTKEGSAERVSELSNARLIAHLEKMHADCEKIPDASDATALHLAIERIRRQSQGAGWQPIETAPKDGTLVALFWPGLLSTGCVTGCFEHGQWYVFLCSTKWETQPTDWKPLVPPPYAPAQRREPAQPSQGECETCGGKGWVPAGSGAFAFKRMCPARCEASRSQRGGAKP